MNKRRKIMTEFSHEDVSIMSEEEIFFWQTPHESFPLASELTEYLTSANKYFFSSLDPVNPGNSLINDVMTWFDDGKTVPSEFLVVLLHRSIEQHKLLPNVVQVQRARCETSFGSVHSLLDATSTSTNLLYKGNLTVVGDLHGQYLDFANIFRDPTFGGFPSTHNRFIINGDMVDRGPSSVEIMVIGMLMKLFFPEDFWMLRGNHEAFEMNTSFGFHEKLDRKYQGNWYLRQWFAQLFNALPVAAVVENAVFVTHGGLGPKVSKLTVEEINRLDRLQEPYSCTPLTELLWADPSGKPGFTSNVRGPRTSSFGPDITAEFLARNSLQWMIRSHQHCDDGYVTEHNGLCWTVFSAPNYCGLYPNLGAVICFSDALDMTPTVLHMLPVQYPELLSPNTGNKNITVTNSDGDITVVDLEQN